MGDAISIDYEITKEESERLIRDALVAFGAEQRRALEAAWEAWERGDTEAVKEAILRGLRPFKGDDA